MFDARHPEVLARDWLPPVATGREVEVAELVRRLDPPRPKAPPPWIVGVAGPRGSGSSTVARRAARTVADLVRESAAETAPRVLAVRTAGLRGTHGVATGLLRHLDPGFEGRGFSVTEILAGFLRRVRREGRPTILVLDDLGVGGPDLGPVLRALGYPDRFLPEGESGLPPTWTILAGTPEGVLSAQASLDGRCELGRPVALAPYSDRTLAAIVRDRADRSLGRPVGPALVARLVARALEEGSNAVVALDLLRRELAGAASRRAERPPFGTRSPAVTVEPHVVRAIESAVRGSEARVGDVRRREAELAEAEGSRPLPATTLWRRIVRLEQAGYLRREIRPGGMGGTLSVVRVLTPVEEWVTSTVRPETRRAAVSWGDVRREAPRGPAGVPASGPGTPPASSRAV
jgi:hypothetical protein